MLNIINLMDVSTHLVSLNADNEIKNRITKTPIIASSKGPSLDHRD